MRARIRSATAALGILAMATAVCGGAAAPGIQSSQPAMSASPALSGRVTVFAAASLTEAFNALGTEFTRANPQVAVASNYAGSSTLVTQLTQGAEADIFASADEPNMQKLVDAKLNEDSARIFANNRLQIVVEAGNPKHIAQLADLARPDLIVVLGAASVPVGAYSLQAFDRAGIRVTAKSLETDAKQVVGKVSLGEADAGIVYSTDVRAGGTRIQGVDIPDRYNVTAKYPIALVKGARNPRAASAFIDFVSSPRGHEVLAGFGFLLP